MCRLHIIYFVFAQLLAYSYGYVSLVPAWTVIMCDCYRMILDDCCFVYLKCFYCESRLCSVMYYK